MALYAIGDLHLSLDGKKSMEVFGGRWLDYISKIERGFSALTDEDVCVLCGDLTWGMSLDDALEDFRFLARLPGKKIILKGNHDYWWSTAAKAYRFFEQHELRGFEILNNNCILYGDYALCGTRGWFYEEERGGEHDKKIMLREIGRLETSLKAAGEREKLVFLHYPPTNILEERSGFTDIAEEYGAQQVIYAHCHGETRFHDSIEGDFHGIRYNLVSGDFLKWHPLKVLD